MSGNPIACRPASYGPYRGVAYAHLASLGVRHVEIELPAAGKLDAARTELARHGLSATSVHGTCDVSRADVAQAVADQMPAARALGAGILFVSVKAGDLPRHVVYGRLREAGEAAGAHGVTIVLETHPDLVTNAAVGLETMRAVDHPNVRINFDTANVYFYNHGADAVAELERLAEFVAAVHLKDTDGGYRHWHFPALGRGVVDFAGVFRVLDEAGYAGPYTLEIEGIEGEERTEALVCGRIAESVEFLRKLGRFARSAGGGDEDR